jgi:ribosomal-protein-alanine N-acetyltransferase
MSGLLSPLLSPPPRAKRIPLDQLDLVLVTPRLRLRAFEDGDVDALWPHVSDPALSRMMSWSAHTDRRQTLEFIRGVNAGFADGETVAWAIEHAGRVVGCISLDKLEFELRAWRVDRGELGYWIAPAWQRRGLVTEAAQAVVRCGFDAIGLHKISVGCVAENLGSRRVIEKLNFRPVGRLEDDVWRDGRWWSVLRYELTASEWSDISTTIRVQRPRPH